MKRTILIFLTVLCSYFGYAQWTSLNSGSIFSLYSVHFADSITGYVVGGCYS